MIDYRLVRSNRKSISLRIVSGRLEVRAPFGAPVHDIEDFILSKTKWITEKLAYSKEQLAKRETITISYGSMIAYRGREYMIVSRDGDQVGFDGKQFFMPPDMEPEEIKEECIQVYKLLAKIYIPKRVAIIAEKMKLMPTAIRITSARSRWGSCSSKKSINFSWMLAMASDRIIDYVIVHELAHIIEMNHSEQFWNIVEKLIPECYELEAQLKELQKRIYIESW